MPAPIIPAPSTATLRAVYFGWPAGRLPPLLMWFRSKKNALIMLVDTCPTARSTKYCVSILAAVSMSTWAPSTAAARMLRCAGKSAPLVCLRRLAGKAGRFAANEGLLGVPPGIL